MPVGMQSQLNTSSKAGELLFLYIIDFLTLAHRDSDKLFAVILQKSQGTSHLFMIYFHAVRLYCNILKWSPGL